MSTDQKVLRFTGADAIQVLPEGEYAGRIVESDSAALGANGMSKVWYTVEITEASSPDMFGKIVNVGITQ